MGTFCSTRQKNKFGLENDFYIVLQHPVTTEISESSSQIKKTIDAVSESGIEAIIVMPNND